MTDIADRLRCYPRMFIALYVLFCIGWGLAATEMMDPFGKPIGYDFMAFWSASRIALDGAPLAAYDPTLLFVAQQQAVPTLGMVFLWHYPPTIYLVVLPLALIPYFWSYIVFTAMTLGVYWGVVRRIATQAGAGMLFLAFPGAFVNAFHGQNAFLTGALLRATLLLPERRPLLAGVCAGLLAIKPHLAVLLPIAFICMGAWRALFAAALAGGTLLVSPYLFDYDLALMALPIAWYGMYVLRHGWRRWEREILVLVWAWPVMIAPLTGAIYLQLAPFVSAALLWMIWRRVREMTTVRAYGPALSGTGNDLPQGPFALISAASPAIRDMPPRQRNTETERYP